MSLFGASKPKGITKEELVYVRGELKSAQFGHSADALNDRQVEELIRRLELCLDPDTVDERKHDWGQVSASEAKQIETQLADDNSLHLSETQKKRVAGVLQKYINIDKHGGMFSL